jgi:dephospho-CoA kinase
MLLIVTGTCGIGKSTVCARLAGTIPGTVLLDADVFAEELVSVVPPNQDYVTFWRSMMRLAHEVAQNGVDAIVYFSTMLPEQVLVSQDLLRYFGSVRFLCLTCPPDVLTERLIGREGDAARAQVPGWVAFNVDRRRGSSPSVQRRRRRSRTSWRYRHQRCDQAVTTRRTSMLLILAAGRVASAFA